MSAEENRFAHVASQPFNPENLKPEFRIANALEYIAAQMWDMNRRLDTLNAIGEAQRLSLLDIQSSVKLMTRTIKA